MNTDPQLFPQASPPPGTRPRLEVLTTLRFFAAATVVLNHWNPETFQNAPWWLRGLTRNGYGAVSFFFVLSGFVLTYTYCDNTAVTKLKGSPSKFWVARIARVCPVYMLALLVALPAFIYSAFVSKVTALPVFFGGLTFVPLALQAWVPPFATAWNTPAWSLSVEAFFYALFPCAIRRLAAANPRKLLAWSLFLVCVSALSRFGVPFIPGCESAKRVFSPLFNFITYFPVFHLSTFIFGMALGGKYLRQTRREWRHQSLLFVVSLTAVIFLFACNGKLAPVLLTDTVLVPLFGVIIFSAATCGGIIQQALSSRWLVELGEASYSVYILHVPLIFWTSAIWRRMPFSQHAFSPVLFFCYWVLLLGVCVVTFELLEKPLRRLITERLGARFAVSTVNPPRSVSTAQSSWA